MDCDHVCKDNSRHAQKEFGPTAYISKCSPGGKSQFVRQKVSRENKINDNK